MYTPVATTNSSDESRRTLNSEAALDSVCFEDSLGYTSNSWALADNQPVVPTWWDLDCDSLETSGYHGDDFTTKVGAVMTPNSPVGDHSTNTGNAALDPTGDYQAEPQTAKENRTTDSKTKRTELRKRHGAMTHTNKTLHLCRYCNVGFRHISKRKMHERVHTNERPHECQFCEKRFKRKSDKKNHEGTHFKERPFVCLNISGTGLCAKEFKTHQQKEKHAATHHANETPTIYPCQHCGKEFNRSHDKNRHERTHTGKKPYKCPDEACDYAATQESNRRRHTRLMH